MHQTMRDQKVQEKASAFIKEILDTEEFIRLSTGSTKTGETSGLLIENNTRFQEEPVADPDSNPKKNAPGNLL